MKKIFRKINKWGNQSNPEGITGYDFLCMCLFMIVFLGGFAILFIKLFNGTL